ncbi:MAG TPA: hypothetical protein PLV92_08285, partial [Pirellulaceae bacterium]|nr:hypothetical protein [Pirellulaceae bacterium]
IMTVVRQAAGTDPNSKKRELDRFLETYGEPLVGHLTARKSYGRDEAREIVYDFFATKLLLTAGSNLAEAYLDKRAQDPQLRFRGYLLTSLRNFLVDRQHTGQRRAVALDVGAVETPLSSADVDVFDLNWAQSLVNQALAAVRDECVAENQLEIWDALVARVGATQVAPGESAASFSHARLTTAVRKVRRRLRTLIRGYLPEQTEVDAVRGSHSAGERHHDARNMADDKASEVLEGDVDDEFGDLRRILRSAARRFRMVTVGGISSREGSAPECEPRILAELMETDEMRDRWRQMLQEPLSSLFAKWRERATAVSVAWPDLASAPGLTLHQVWCASRPELTVLRAIRDFAKQASRAPVERSNSLPSDSELGALYLTAIGLARLRLDIWLSRDNEAEFAGRLDALLAFEWLDPETRRIADDWRALLAHPTSPG